MATYPTLKQTIESKQVALSGIVTDEGGNLTLWVRDMAPVEKFKFSVVHVVTKAEYDTLMTFYSANKIIPFAFVYRDNLAVTYPTCLFTDRPQKVAHHARNLFTVRVEIRTQ